MRKIFILVLLNILIFPLVSCSDKDSRLIGKGDTLNQELFKYLTEDDYGIDSRIIVYTREQLLEYVEDDDILEKYESSYFNQKNLVIFRFATHYLEREISIINVRRVDHDIYIDINVDSPANEDNIAFDTQIHYVTLTMEIPQHLGDLNYESDRVSILVINSRFENTYRSIYYNCENKKEN